MIKLKKSFAKKRCVFYSFALDKPPGHEKKRKNRLPRKLKKSVLNGSTFKVEDDENKRFVFNGETITFALL